MQNLFDTLGSRFGQRRGGYTRITHGGPREGDGAGLAERAKRKEERLKAQQEGPEPEADSKE